MDDVVVMVADLLRAALARQQDRADARAVLEAAIEFHMMESKPMERCIEEAVDALVMVRDKLAAAADLPDAADPHGDVKFSGLIHGEPDAPPGGH